MRIFAISDLHLDSTHSKPMGVFDDVWEEHTDEILKSAMENSLCEDDILIIAGDISWAMKLEDAKADFDFFKNFKCRVLIVRGNHDYWWSSLSKVRDALPTNVHAIQNDAIKIGNYIFCGTRGWNIKESARFSKEDEKIYDREVIRLNLSIEHAKKLQKNEEEIICIMHYPPFNSKKDESEFTSVIKEAKINKVVFGHLHGNNNSYSLITEIDGVNYYLTSCDKVKNKLVKIT